MHKVRFYPLGNADTTLIMLDSEKAILFDCADMLDREDEYDKRIDLPSELEQTVDGDFEVVAFTHADQDHINKFSEFFFLEHADKYDLLKQKPYAIEITSFIRLIRKLIY